MCEKNKYDFLKSRHIDDGDVALLLFYLSLNAKGNKIRQYIKQNAFVTTKLSILLFLNDIFLQSKDSCCLLLNLKEWDLLLGNTQLNR